MNTSANSSTTNRWLSKSTELLKNAGIATARLDCLVLLEDATGRDRSWLLAHPETSLQGLTLQTLNKKVERRSGHEPLAYIRGKSEFYGREFIVNPHTLEPRPETETMISQLHSLLKVGPFTEGENVNIVDVGTGSGCIAITAKLEFPYLTVVATDIDEKCIDTARKNTEKLKANVTFHKGSLLEPVLSSRLSVLLCNLPYVPDDYHINEAAQFEPRPAIFGGPDGLDVYRQLFKQTKELRSKPPYILTESLPFQHAELINIAQGHNYLLDRTDDFIQIFVYRAGG